MSCSHCAYQAGEGEAGRRMDGWAVTCVQTDNQRASTAHNANYTTTTIFGCLSAMLIEEYDAAA